jgi:hypothetical protein
MTVRAFCCIQFHLGPRILDRGFQSIRNPQS